MTAATRLRDDRAAAEGITASVQPIAAFAREAAAWDDLVRRAVEPNPHYSRQVVEAHRASGLAPSDLSILSVSCDGRLLALLPFTVAPEPLDIGRRVATPFLSPYVTQTAPLVAADAPSGTLDALVTGLALASGGRPWRWPLMPLDGHGGIVCALRRCGWTIGSVASFERAVFVRRTDLAGALAASPNRDRLKDLRRRRRRLAQRGVVALATAQEGAALAEAVETFLALELKGWKGRRGTALASRPTTSAFARALFGGSGPVSLRADLLCLDGEAIAASLALVAGGTATLLKTAYDETFRSFAPGVLLEAEIVRAFHETCFAERLDAATHPGSVLDSLYPDRVTIADLVATPPGTTTAIVGLGALVARARLQRQVSDGLKRALSALGVR